jgi:hypothetical protein
MEMSKQKLVLGLAVVGLCFLCWLCYQRCNMDPCTKCNEIRSTQDANILFFNTTNFCSSEAYSLLNPAPPLIKQLFENQQGLIAQDIENLPLMNIDTFSNTCGQPIRPILTLAGYYIEPSVNLNTNQLVKLKFFPIWLKQNVTDIFEIIGEEIIITPEKRAHTSDQDLGGTDNNLPLITPQSVDMQNGFDHSLLQFHAEAVRDTFMKAFISWYQLKLIVENCEYLGITGALISRGNIMGIEWGRQNAGTVVQSNNKSYFTYRFIGFNEYEDSGTFVRADVWPKDKRTAVMSTNKSNNETSFRHAIPTEAYATPCPPMWYEQ